MCSFSRRNWLAMAAAVGLLAVGLLAAGGGAARAQGNKATGGKMSPQALAKAKRYIASLKLPAAKGGVMRKLAMPAAGKPGAYVDEATLLSMTENLEPQQRMDVLNSVLLAQLAARHEFDPEKQTEQFYRKYNEVLANIGWVTQSLKFQRYQSRGTKFTVDAEVINVLLAVCSGPEGALIKATLKAVKKAGANNSAVTLFEHSSRGGDNGNFRIGLAANRNGVVVLKQAAIYYANAQNVTSVLFFSFSSASTQFYYGTTTIELNTDVYSQVRSLVIQKLGNHAAHYIQQLPAIDG
jgi:hypothetical protein